MPEFHVRIELRDSESSDYDALHKEMTKRKFSRTVQLDNGKWYWLPTAEYLTTAYATIDACHDSAAEAVAAIGKTARILVVEFSLLMASDLDPLKLTLKIPGLKVNPKK
jgi:hypothetical protein